MSWLFFPAAAEEFQYDLTLASGYNNLNLWSYIGAPEHSVSVRLTIASGTTVGSTTASGGTASLVIDGFVSGSTVQVVNYGSIIGKGGDGGTGGSGKVFSNIVQGGGGGGGAGSAVGAGGSVIGSGAEAGTAGTSTAGGTGGDPAFSGDNLDTASAVGEGGGNAIYAYSDCTIHNYGEIWGGGGGGAGGNPTGYDADGENQGAGGDGGDPGEPGEPVYGLAGQVVRNGGAAGLSIYRAYGTTVTLIDDTGSDIRGDQAEAEAPS